MFCPKCGAELSSSTLQCSDCGEELPLDLVISENQLDTEIQEYFEQPISPGDGLCSDPQCPCPEVRIPRGEGYLYIPEDAVEFRRNARTLQELKRKIEWMEEQTNYLIVLGHGVAGPILVCGRGARLRNLNLGVAAADARRWWQSGLVPLRSTPTVAAGPEADGTDRSSVEAGIRTPDKASSSDLTPEHARSQLESVPPQQVPEQTICFVCGVKAADPVRPIIVHLKKERRLREVQVPSCPQCHALEAAAERRVNGIGLAVSVLPIILGIVVGLPDDWLRGGFLGLGVGWLGGIGVRAFLGGRGKSCQHPAIKRMTEHGWDVDHLY